MTEAYIIGVGHTKFGKFPDRPHYDFGREAVITAVKDAGVDHRDIQAGYAGNVTGGTTPGQKLFKQLGMTGMPIINVENTCSSGATAVHLAYRAIVTGQYDLVIAFLQQIQPENLKSGQSVARLIGYFERNRDYIPCYALRKQLGLRNSSNKGEKANDLCVAERQKHNGMSWSKTGSVALATVISLHLNNEQDHWRSNHKLSFSWAS